MAEEKMQGEAKGGSATPAGGDEIKVTSGSAEQGPGKLNPSAPGETGTSTKAQGVVSKK